MAVSKLRCGLLAGEEHGAGGRSRTLTGLLSPADFLTVYGFRRLEMLQFAVWTIPSPFHEESEVSVLPV